MTSMARVDALETLFRSWHDVDENLLSLEQHQAIVKECLAVLGEEFDQAIANVAVEWGIVGDPLLIVDNPRQLIKFWVEVGAEQLRLERKER